jgi:hypothetical protein
MEWSMFLTFVAVVPNVLVTVNQGGIGETGWPVDFAHNGGRTLRIDRPFMAGSDHS